jgi:acetylornithine deacetylase/succinyl-diaminopimelate desuccinylase-like protein
MCAAPGPTCTPASGVGPSRTRSTLWRSSWPRCGARGGKILVEGFYDDVRPLSESDRVLMAAVPFDAADCRATLGVEELFGEPGYSTAERRTARPTLEVNGIWGGYQGEGVKTVLPSEAHAKITCRLVLDQEPARVRECLMAHITKYAPRGVTVTARPLAVEARPYEVRPDDPGNRAAHAVLEEIYGKPPYYIRGGGTLPVLDLFHRHLGTDMVMFGFSLLDEQFHAPDEFFRLSSFQRGQRAYVKLLQRLGQEDSRSLHGTSHGSAGTTTAAPANCRPER